MARAMAVSRAKAWRGLGRGNNGRGAPMIGRILLSLAALGSRASRSSLMIGLWLPRVWGSAEFTSAI